MYRNNPLLLTIVLLSLQYCVLANSFVLQSNVTMFNAMNDLPAGMDTIFLATDSITGKRGALKIKNLIGNSSNPIVITNMPGDTFILDADSFYYALSFENAHHFILTGNHTGDQYTFQVTGGTGTAVSLGEFCSDFTIRNIEIYGVPGSGIKAKTFTYCGRPDTRFYPSDSIYPDPSGIYVMQNVNIQENYIHDVGEEGMYIGESFYPKREDVCGYLYSHEIHSILIENNKVENTGWDGIQVGCATINCTIRKNEVLNYGTDRHAWHANGFQIGHGTTGTCSNNWVEYGFGHGILMNGTGANKIYNNVLLQIGKNYTEGSPCDLANPNNANSATCSDQEDFESKAIVIRNPDSSFYATSKTDGYWIVNNTILGVKSGAIEFAVDSSVTIGSKINNNLLSDYNFLHSDELAIEVAETAVANYCNNYIENDADQVGFSNTAYNTDSLGYGIGKLTDVSLVSSSLAINSGTTLAAVDSVDYRDSVRTQLGRIDIGAFEYDGTTYSNTPFEDCPCNHFITSSQLDFDGTSASPGDTICLLAGKRSVLELENLEGSETLPIVITNHGGVVDFRKETSTLLEVKNSGHVQIVGNGESHNRIGLDFQKEGVGTVIGLYLSNVNSVKVKGVKMYDVNTGIRYRFNALDTSLCGERELEMSDINICKGDYGLYMGYSSGFSGQEAWALGTIRADNVMVDSVDVGALIYGVDHEDTVSICNSVFTHIEQYAVKAEQNSMELYMEKNKISDVGYNVVYSKSSYPFPIHFDIINNVMIRAGNNATSGSDKSVPVFVNFQQKSGHFHAYHNTISGFDADLGIKTKYSGNADQEVKNNLLLSETTAYDLIELNGSNVSDGNYENTTTSTDTAGFVNYSGDDLSILPGSVWIDSGDSTVHVNSDINGNMRTDSVPDVGAYENTASSKRGATLPIDNTEVVLDDINTFKVNVYPNPMMNQIQVERDSDESWDYVLYDVSRKVLRKGRELKRSVTLDVSDLSKGIYFLNVISNSSESVVKTLTKL